MNKSWYEQTNEFYGCVEIINDNGKGTIRITHTSSETKDIAEHIVKNQIKQFKSRGLLTEDANPQKILFSKFDNSTRFTFFFRLGRLYLMKRCASTFTSYGTRCPGSEGGSVGHTLRHKVPRLRRSVYYGMPLGICFGLIMVLAYDESSPSLIRWE